MQDEPTAGNMEANLVCMETYARQAGKNGLGVDLLVFPELFVTGYVPALWETYPTPADELAWRERLIAVARTEGIGIVYGHPSWGGQNGEPRTMTPAAPAGEGHALPLYNAASLVTGDGWVGTYAKVHLFGREKETFTAGADFPVWETPFGRISVQICYDLEFPEAARVAALNGAELLVYPSNNMIPYARHHEYFTMARAMENQVFVATVNRTGRESDIVFCGGSCVAHPDGTWLIQPVFQAGLYVCDVNLDDRQRLDEAVNYLVHRRPETYGALVPSVP